MKLLRTIRLDPSDTFVFERAAEPGEWAVSGSFMFADDDADRLEGKARAAFRSGFLGVPSFGWSTLVQIVDATEAEYAAAVGLLAERFVEAFGAPTMEQARAAAEQEFAFASSLCVHASGTLIAIHRTQEHGSIREAFRSLQPKDGPKPFRAFSFLEADDDDQTATDQVDLVELSRKEGESR